jgi:uncharacterized protein (TIRG00374 family)
MNACPIHKFGIRGRPMRKRLLVLGAVSIVLILSMVLVTDPEEIWDKLKDTDFSIILCVIGLYLINGVVKAARWQVLLRSFGSEVSFKRLYMFLLVGLMVNNTTPGRVGGEPVRAYLLRMEDETPMGQGLSTVFVERIMDLVVLLSMALTGIIIILPQLLRVSDEIQWILFAFVPMIILIVALLYLASRPTLLKKATRFLFSFFKRFWKGRWIRKAEDGLTSFVDSFSDGFKLIRKEVFKVPRRGVAFTGLTVAIWINEAARIYLILISLPIDEVPSFGAVLIASSVATVFGALLPIGAMHATLITTVFAIFRVDVASATTAGILTVGTSIWFSIPLGIVAMFIVGLKRDKSTGELIKKEMMSAERDEEVEDGAE